MSKKIFLTSHAMYYAGALLVHPFWTNSELEEVIGGKYIDSSPPSLPNIFPTSNPPSFPTSPFSLPLVPPCPTAQVCQQSSCNSSFHGSCLPYTLSLW